MPYPQTPAPPHSYPGTAPYPTTGPISDHAGWGPGGASGGGFTAYDPIGALKEGWAKFSESPSTLMVPVLVVGIVQGVVWTIYYFVVIVALLAGVGATANADYETTNNVATGAAITFALGTALLIAATQASYAGLSKGGLDVADGRRPTMSEMFAGWSKGRVFGLALLLGLVAVLGTYLFYIPTILAAVAAQFAVLDVIAAGTGIFAAIKRSTLMVIAHPGPILVFDILAAIIAAVAALPCGLGLLIALPVLVVAQARTYRAFAAPAAQ